MPIHGWIYRRTELSRLRRAGLGLARRYVQARHQPPAEALRLFTERFGSFLADNERNERVRVRIGQGEVVLRRSRADGHIRDSVSLDLPAEASGWLEFQATHAESEGVVRGKSLLLRAEGVSVISDVDDTIKLTNVLQRRELLRNTFGRPFACVPGMAELYRRWEREMGASFHYVSASPWHLFPFLEELLKAQDFPVGTWHLRDFRLAGSGLAQALRSSRSVKRKHIEGLLACYPERRFILVGDSGEYDAEIYSAVARECPGQVQAIYIRNVTGEGAGSARWQRAFDGVPRERWHVFDEVCEVPVNG
ncbi:MAG: phosphatidate phosphatase App1 family protein [Phycisphaerae bacterium]